MRMKKFLQQFDSSHNVSSENEDKYNFASRSLNNILDAMFHLGLKILENDAYLTTENNETEQSERWFTVETELSFSNCMLV